jgi:hypothetical protein
MDERIRRVRALMTELSPQLSTGRVESAEELLDNDEPNEALLGIAWDIAAGRLQVPDEALRFIEETVGDPKDLPVDLSGPSDPPMSRRPQGP